MSSGASGGTWSGQWQGGPNGPPQALGPTPAQTSSSSSGPQYVSPGSGTQSESIFGLASSAVSNALRQTVSPQNTGDGKEPKETKLIQDPQANSQAQINEPANAPPLPQWPAPGSTNMPSNTGGTSNLIEIFHNSAYNIFLGAGSLTIKIHICSL